MGRNVQRAEDLDGRVAAGIWRGVARRLIDEGQAALAELPLGNGRRADLIAIDPGGLITIIEIKSCRADFVADHKWYAYLDFCDRFYFAVGAPYHRNRRSSNSIA
jgi:hypothetical protein